MKSNDEQIKDLKEDLGRVRTYEEMLATPKPERCPEMEWNKILALAYMRDKGLNLDMIPMSEKAGFRVYPKDIGKEVEWFHLKDHGDLIKELKRLFNE